MAAILLSLTSKNATRATVKRSASIHVLLANAFLGLWLVCCAPIIHADEAADKAKLEAVRKNIAALKAELEKTKSDREQLLKALESTEKNIGELNKKASQIKRQINEGESKVEALKDERSELQIKKKNEQQHVGQHINAAYRLGQQSSLKLLFNQQDPTTVERNIRYYDYFVKARSEKIASYTATITRLDAIEKEFNYETDQLKNNYASLKKQQQELASQKNKREATVAKLSRAINSKAGELSQLEKDRQNLAKLIQQVTQILDETELRNDTRQFAGLRGQLPWPTQGRVLNSYGSSRVGNKVRWQGMLIGANAGSPVKAIHNGRVVFSDYLRGHGLLIIVDHGAGYLSLYAHNDALYKELGEWVAAGETIATVGNTGGQQQSALYFELRHHGKPTDPKRWFKSA